MSNFDDLELESVLEAENNDVGSDEQEQAVLSETADAADAVAEKSWKYRLAKSIYEWMDAAVFVLIAISIIFTFVARQVEVSGDSMLPTLHSGERLVMSNFFYQPKQGDIVIINRYRQAPLIKRVVAVGGDRLDFDKETGKVLVNGEVVDDSFTQGFIYSLGTTATKTPVVPEGHIFVLGDNRGNSLDSKQYGYFSVNDVMGKAVFRFLPFDNFGGLY